MEINRPTQKNTKLEAVRGFAAVYIVLHHLFGKSLIIAGKDFSILFRFGQEAVILFFLLSGFVIQYSFTLSADKSFKTFFSKRFLRIYIPLICVFIANYTLIVLQFHTWFRIHWYTIAENLLMLQNTPAFKPNIIILPFLRNTPLWSLSFEWWFYMIFFVVITRIKANTSLFIYAIGIVAALTYLIYPGFINRELMYLIIWWVGADIAILYLKKEDINFISLKIPLIALAVTCFILVINVKIHNQNSSPGVSPFLELRHFSFALFTVFVAIIWRRLNWVCFKFTIGLFEKIAPISFGIYISHWFLIIRATYLNGIINNPFLRLGLYSLICVLFAYIVERVIYISLNRWFLSKLNTNWIKHWCTLIIVLIGLYR